MISTLYKFPWSSPKLYTVLLTFEPRYVVLGFYFKLANTVTDHDPKYPKQDDPDRAEAAAARNSFLHDRYAPPTNSSKRSNLAHGAPVTITMWQVLLELSF